MIEEMEVEASMQLAAAGDVRARACVRSSHKGNPIEVRARRLKNGKQVFGYSFCAVRLERAVLLQLLSPDSTCPHCRRTQARWRAFLGQVEPTPQRPRESFQFRHLVEEVEIVRGGQICIARPAIFQCLSPCPIGAHPPEVISKGGWDLFANGKYVAGGLTTNASTGMREPMFSSIEAVRTWMDKQTNQGSD